MKKRQAEYKETYSAEMKWFKKNMDLIKENSFLLDMYNILLTGSRPMSEKMVAVIHKSMKNWRYDPVERTMKEERMKPVLEKISLLEEIVKVVDGNRIHTRFSAFGFLLLPFVPFLGHPKLTFFAALYFFVFLPGV